MMILRQKQLDLEAEQTSLVHHAASEKKKETAGKKKDF